MKCFVQKLQRHCHKFEHSIGDYINDLPAMELAGYVGYPADSSDDVKLIADYVSLISGGYGAVRDVVEHLLRTAIAQLTGRNSPSSCFCM